MVRTRLRLAGVPYQFFWPLNNIWLRLDPFNMDVRYAIEEYYVHTVVSKLRNFLFN